MSVERVFQLVRHLTERDREIVLRPYRQQVLTTDQLALMFFSSKRRAQDRLLFLYRERVVDRFYPPSRFGSGKPQAHWLLDEAGALIVAAMLGVGRKQLGWQRREEWSSHPQLAHRLESNRFVTDLIAATLSSPSPGVTAWYSTRDAAERLLGDRGSEFVRPDAGFILVTPRGPIECYLEWDRGTESGERLDQRPQQSRRHPRQYTKRPKIDARTPARPSRSCKWWWAPTCITSTPPTSCAMGRAFLDTLGCAQRPAGPGIVR